MRILTSNAPLTTIGETMEKIEAQFFTAEEVYQDMYYTIDEWPVKQARKEGKLVLLSRCDCGCWRGQEGEEKMQRFEKNFGDDPLVLIGVARFYLGGEKGFKGVIVLPKGTSVADYGRALPVRK